MIADVRLQNFRSYKDAAFEFGDGVNIIVGPNGSGKTNLLEALLVLSRGSSYRTNDSGLLQFAAEWSRIDGHTTPGGDRTIKIRGGAITKKTYSIDEKTYIRLPAQKKIPTVLFEPNHLLILQGAPDARRAYLDDILEQTAPGYTSFRKNYQRVVSQRNALLKQPNASQKDFFPWNLRLSELGAVLHRSRLELVESFNETIKDLYAEMAGKHTDVRLSYESKLNPEKYETQLLELLEANLHQDLQRGFTAYGPHREDMGAYIGQNPVQLVASRGEIRTLTLALKVLELQALAAATGQKPILLLDDVFSELDGARRRALTTYLQRYQTFLTTTDADIVIKHFTSCTIIPLAI